MADDPAQQFADALQRYESDGDLDAFVEVFSDDVVLLRPEQEQEVSGLDGARTYWQQYSAQFSSVRSEFDRVVAAGGVGVLEWKSYATAKGNELDYRGVSLLDFDDSGKVKRFATYFDTAAFTVAARQAAPPA